MKTYKTFKTGILTMVFFLTFVSISIAQSSKLDNFFKYEGAKLLSDLAHPFTTYDSLTYYLANDHAIVTMKSSDYITKLTVYWNSSHFYMIDVDENDFFPAFEGTKAMKDLLVKLLEDDDASKVAKKFGKELINMTGKELACVMLTLAWYAY